MPADLAKAINRGIQRVPRWLLYTLGLVPAVAYFTLGVLDQLGADPMRALEQELGIWALRFLIATLCVTPLRQLTGINLIRYRRALGLLAFYYASFHLSTYLILDQGLDWASIWKDIVKRPYITIGMATFVLLVPLAVTSNNASVRAMGGKAWAKLHKLVYLAAIGGAAHYLLVVKSWPLDPMIYAGIIAALLLWRLVRASLPVTTQRACPSSRSTRSAASSAVATAASMHGNSR